MKIRRAYRYRFYPTPEQEAQLARTFGCVRAVYNWGLEQRTRAFYERRQRLYYKDLAKALTALKKEPEWSFLKEVSNVTLQQALRHLDRAFANFFARRASYPKFKSKRDSVQSASYMRNAFTFRNGKLTLAKQNAPLDIRWSRPLPAGAQPLSVTVTRTSAGRYYVSLLVEEEVRPMPQASGQIGLDMNTGAVVDSNGNAHRLPMRIEALERRKRRYQRAQRRKIAAAKARMGLAHNAPLPKGVRLKISNNLRKAACKVARVQERIAAIRRDWQHKLTTSIVRENQVIAIEDLSVRGMTAKGRGKRKAGLNRAVLNVGFAELRRQLEYKAQWAGREVIAIDRFYPSSKRCSACGYVLPSLPLSVRRWECPACGATHDRDANAAKNILAAALAIKADAAALRIDEPRDAGG